jgi:ribosomal protein S24E
MTYTSVAHCGTDHSHWIKDLGFYDDELDTLEKRLLEIVQKNNGSEVMAGVEHFQNQFVVQRNNIDELLHAVHEHDRVVAKEAQEHAGKIKSTEVDHHLQLKEQMESFEKVFNELRHEYNGFLSKWM